MTTAATMAQPSNRMQLLEGTLACLERLPPERVTARAIADASGANLASIVYHFGSKDALVTEAVILGLDRWLEDIGAGLARLDRQDPDERLRSAARVVETSRNRYEGLARNFVGAVAKAQYVPELRALLVQGFTRTRKDVARLLGLGADRAGQDAAGLVVAMFNGLLMQSLLDPGLAIEGRRMDRAQARLRGMLPDEAKLRRSGPRRS